MICLASHALFASFLVCSSETGYPRIYSLGKTTHSLRVPIAKSRSLNLNTGNFVMIESCVEILHHSHVSNVSRKCKTSQRKLYVPRCLLKFILQACDAQLAKLSSLIEWIWGNEIGRKISGDSSSCTPSTSIVHQRQQTPFKYKTDYLHNIVAVRVICFYTQRLHIMQVTDPYRLYFKTDCSIVF